MDRPIDPAQLTDIGGLSIELREHGTGPSLLLLHGAEGPATIARCAESLAARYRVIVPSHPGFGASPLPDWFDSIDDLAYLYLDLLERLDLEDTVVIGFSMGAWIAAEIAIRNQSRISRLVLVSAVGIRIGDRETRNFPDIYALPPEEVARLTYHDSAFAPKIDQLSDEALIEIARHREAAALFLWEPYMHNPKLLRRLRRITVPTLLVRGAHDGIVSQAYSEAYRAAIPSAALEIVAASGHLPEVEQPQALTALIEKFIRGSSPAHTKR